LVVAGLTLGIGAAPAPGETKAKLTRAETEAALQRMFPQGELEGREGVMKLGGQFRTVAIRAWPQCRELCFKNPAIVGTSGCVLWTFVKAKDPQMPNVCRMWWDLPELRDNELAVSGAGKLK
jgi:hypothetical protein